MHVIDPSIGPTTDSIVFSIFVIFSGSALLATLALYARQALLVGYIIWGILLGPFALSIIPDIEVIKGIADIGIIFLLFLLGLSLEPQGLLHLLGKTTLITLLSSSLFALLGIMFGLGFGFSWQDSLVIGATMMFSSTIIGLKLLPTTVLHHKRAGEIIVSILLLQDLIAILLLLVLQGLGKQGSQPILDILVVSLELPFLLGFALLFERLVLNRLMRQFDKIQEYIFLITIGWCLGMAELASFLNLSHEIGAFIGGVVLASNPIARFISESLKPLRDFFLVIFFFSLGASLNLPTLQLILFPATLLAATLLLIKPWIFNYLLIKFGEASQSPLEIGCRLGQVSEFSLLVAVVALETHLISDQASYLIQAATIMTFIASSYYIILRYPTPIAVSDRLRRD